VTVSKLVVPVALAHPALTLDRVLQIAPPIGNASWNARSCPVLMTSREVVEVGVDPQRPVAG
jgi:hypothetical protein